MVLPNAFLPGTSFDIPLWDKRPERWLRAEERKGKWAFERGYRQNAPRSEDRMFGDLSKFLLYGIKVRDLIGPDNIRIGAFDPAGSNRVGNALITVGLPITRAGLQRVIVGADIWQGSYEVTASRIASSYAINRHALMLVENNGTQETFQGLIRAAVPPLAVDGWLTGSNKWDIKKGLPGLETEIRTGLWALCMDDPYDTGDPLDDHDADCECPYHVLIADLNNFPSPGRSYDLLMAMWFASRGVERIFMYEAVADAAARPIDDDRSVIPEEEMVGNVFDRDRAW